MARLQAPPPLHLDHHHHYHHHHHHHHQPPPQQPLQGAGSIRFWGFTPPLDLAEAAKDVVDPSAPLRALLVGPGDTRHLLATLAANARRAAAAAAVGAPPPPLLEMSVYEDAPESLARQLLLLSIALDFELPRRERAEIYLEVFANTQLREKTAVYVASRAAALRRMLARGDGPLAAHVDVSLLKMKERDALEEVLQTYGEGVEFDAVRHRDERLRRYYDARYDSRKNVLDWDYTMELLPLAPIVHKIHFREWRMTGLAFELRDSAYTAPNLTLASMAFGKERGLSKMRRGYWGDVVNSPFVAAGGVEADEPKLFERRSNQQVKTACDVAYYTVLSWLTALETGAPFALQPADVADFSYGSSIAGNAGWAKGILKKGGAGAEGAGGAAAGAAGAAGAGAAADLPRIEELEEAFAESTLAEGGGAAAGAGSGAARGAEGGAGDAEAEGETAEKTLAREAAKARVVAAKFARLPPFRLRLLSGEWPDLLRKPKHARHYDLLYVASHAAHLLADERVGGLLAPRARVVLESAKFLLEARKAARSSFGEVLIDLGAMRGWTVEPAPGGVEPGPAPDGATVAHFLLRHNEATAGALADANRGRLEVGEAVGDPDEALGSVSLDDKAAGGAGGAEGMGGEKGVAAESGAAESGAADFAVGAGAPGGAGGAGGAASRVSAGAVALEAGGDAGVVAELKAPAANVCAVTGLPAKYRDPVSGLPYANLEAFRELRKLHPAPERVLDPSPKPEGGAEGGAEGEQGGEQGGAEGRGGADRPAGLLQRPIVLSTGMPRRINRAF